MIRKMKNAIRDGANVEIDFTRLACVLVLAYIVAAGLHVGAVSLIYDRCGEACIPQVLRIEAGGLADLHVVVGAVSAVGMFCVLVVAFVFVGGIVFHVAWWSICWVFARALGIEQNK